MILYHDSRKQEYREPFGAAPVGTVVRLALDVSGGESEEVFCRLWIDGRGEKLFPMRGEPVEGGQRFSCQIPLTEAALYWYTFLVKKPNGEAVWYGARRGKTGGAGVCCEYEPPSFQITSYVPREVPTWYLNGIVYQIFPDRFARGSDYEQRAEAVFSKEKKNGVPCVLVRDWETVPGYEKDAQGRVTSWEFYGGTLTGIREKLGYLKQMGVTVLYLNPIFQAASNHRYDTGDYRKIDPLLGDPESFALLAKAAEEEGISLILDGVFNHAGCDSLYFNRYGNYDSYGAYQGEDSPYRDWFDIHEDGSYECWWGVDDLPCFHKENKQFRRFLYGDPDSVVRFWLAAGARGWRLDVADELSDDLLAGIKQAAVDTRGSDALLIGEVWEDASNKVSYGKLRRYFLGEELDGVMNYPLLDALQAFLLGTLSGEDLRETLVSLQENYPPSALYASLNLMGSHDRVRLITVLGGAPDPACLSEEKQRVYRLSEQQRGLAKARIWLAALVQMTVPGVPCIYYGDEAGLEGYADPYNRGTFPWGHEDADLQTIYRNAIDIRRSFSAFTAGEWTLLPAGENVLLYLRRDEAAVLAVAVNRSLSDCAAVEIPVSGEEAFELISGKELSAPIERGGARYYVLHLAPLGSALVYFPQQAGYGKPMAAGSGVLCHITSLPAEKQPETEQGRCPGTIGAAAREFIDLLAEAKQSYWQILPLNPTDAFGSPYAGASAFAANCALLSETESELRAGFASFAAGEDYEKFCTENADWLSSYALFTALKKRFDGQPWQNWPQPYRRYSETLKQQILDGEEETAQEYGFVCYAQYCFQKEWDALHAYAGEKGIAIIGDLPMYVSSDSADVWANPGLFTVDEDGNRTEEAGAPPDYFDEEGQLWGNPFYRWDEMKKTNYAWWMQRFARAFRLYDYVRLDHFRGYASGWSVPQGKKANEGAWKTGPGEEIFRLARERFGPLPILAEDLGSITPQVRSLMAQCRFPGMDVLQFSDTDPREDYCPMQNKIAFTGTHDNQTLLSWCEKRYPEQDAAALAKELREKVMRSRAKIVMFPLQDVLLLDDSTRMNTPGTTEKNWQWQVETLRSEACEKAFAKLREATQNAGREPQRKDR